MLAICLKVLHDPSLDVEAVMFYALSSKKNRYEGPASDAVFRFEENLKVQACWRGLLRLENINKRLLTIFEDVSRLFV